MPLAAPGLLPPARRSAVCVRHLGVGVGPEPALDTDWLKVLPLSAAGEVTEAARRPDVSDVAWSRKGKEGVNTWSEAAGKESNVRKSSILETI